MNPAPTVLHVVNSLDIGGTEKQLYLLLKHLDHSQFSSAVVALSEGGHWARRIRELGVDLIQLPRRGSYELNRLLGLARLVCRQRPAIIHTWQPAGNLYGGIAALLARHSRLILSCRSIDRQRGLRAIVDAGVYRRATAVICNSRALASDLLQRGRVRTPPVVIYNGIEADGSAGRDGDTGQQVRARLGLPATCQVVGSVGRMVPFKNQRLIIEIAAEILAPHPDCYFLLIGDGPTRTELEQLARSLGVAERVLFLGTRDDVPALLAGCDVFLFPSRRQNGADGVAGEGFPNAVMEALQARLPCVASLGSGAEELFADGEAGYLMEPDDQAGFVAALLALLRDDPLRSALGARGHAIVQQRFAAATMAQRFADLYRAALARAD